MLFIYNRHMKKQLLILVLSSFFLGCTTTSYSITEEYEMDSNVQVTEIEDSDKYNYTWMEDDNPAFIEISFEDSLNFFRNGWSGVLYYGKVGCRFCERAAPLINKAAKAAGIQIYYIDSSKNMGETEEIANANYEEIGEYISDSFVEGSDGVKGMYVPDVVGVKNGKMVDYKEALADGYNINEQDQMNDEQKQQLYNKYIEIIKKVYEN